MDDAKRYDNELRSILLEKPRSFSADGKRYNLYPATLGKSMLISEELENISEGKISAEDIVSATTDKKGLMCRILAYHTLETREELLNTALVDKRTKELEKGLDDKVLAGLLLIVHNEIPLEKLYHHIGLDVDRKDLAKINKVKQSTSKNSLSFGGRSLFGTLIAPACEKFHLTPRQVIWEIGYRQLQMLMADAVQTVYLTDEELKKCHITNERDVINMDDKNSKDIIKSMEWS